MTDIPVKDQIYRHFKGNLYRIVTVAIHSETGERMVVYQALYGDFTVYVRELSMFMGAVDRNRYPDADQEERFQLVTQLIGQESGAGLQVRTSPDEPIRIQAGTDETVQTPDERGVSEQAAVDPGMPETDEDRAQKQVQAADIEVQEPLSASEIGEGAADNREPEPEAGREEWNRESKSDAGREEQNREPKPEAGSEERSREPKRSADREEQNREPKSDAGREEQNREPKADTGREEWSREPDRAADGREQAAAENVQAEDGEQAEGQAAVSQDGETEDETAGLDPFLLEFLDADTYRERLNLLAALHVRLTDDMLNTMAVSVDVEIGDGDLETRYEALKNCLLTLEKYECNRVR